MLKFAIIKVIMDNKLQENLNALQLIIKKLENIKQNFNYGPIQDYCITLQLRLESLLIAPRINKDDYTRWRKAILNLIKEIKKIFTTIYPKHTTVVNELKDDIKNFLSYYDTKYLTSKKELSK